ncbi:MAG: DNA repair protein RecN [Chlorobi bacterium]|nr:DNA repair protein RecN [Chlorobiota bacterium]
MLQTLFIKDYAIIDELTIEFGAGLNVITGETGAGKSILVDSLGLILGERSSTEAIRRGAKKTIVEAVFEIDSFKKIKNILDEEEIETNAELIIRREVNLKGNSRAFANDSPITINKLKEIGAALVDLHGQHEHQSLLYKENHIQLLDEFCGFEKELEEFAEKIKTLESKRSELKKLLRSEKESADKIELYKFQAEEIDAVSPTKGEDEKLENRLKKLENAEYLATITAELYERLYEGEGSTFDSLQSVQTILEKLLSVDGEFKNAAEEFENILTQLGDVSDFLRRYCDSIEIDSEELESARERLSSINLLKKKYGGSVDALISYREKIEKEIESEENLEENINALKEEIKRLGKELGALAANLSKKRKAAAKEVEREVVENLKELGVGHAKFEIRIEPLEAAPDEGGTIPHGGKAYKYTPRGFDAVEFFISTNVGETVKPLAKTASGGEISRVMLALKSVMAKRDKLPLLIFDEIDVGISGQIARKVGRALKNLSAMHQIIAITHLPQIASFGNHHYSVLKIEKEGRTVTAVKKLDDDGRIGEVAKLMSGDKLTETTLNNARELLNLNN